MKPEPLLAYALNGEPLTRDQGFPVRLIMPGWYGVANVKWLSEMHLQEDRYLGNFQARWYRSLRGVGGTGEDTDPARSGWRPKSPDMHLKSVIARVRKNAGGTPGSRIRAERRHAAEVGGSQSRRRALAEGHAGSKPTRSIPGSCSPIDWEGATPGEHTLVSRVTDVDGTVQPTAPS